MLSINLMEIEPGCNLLKKLSETVQNKVVDIVFGDFVENLEELGGEPWDPYDYEVEENKNLEP